MGSPTGSYQLPLNTYGLSLIIFALFSCVRKRFRPSDPDMMTNTALEATVTTMTFSAKLWFEHGDSTRRKDIRFVPSFVTDPENKFPSFIRDKMKQ